MCDVRGCSNFILIHIAAQFSQKHLLKRLSFIHCMLLTPLSWIRRSLVHGLISGLSLCFINLYFCLCAGTILS